MKPKFSIGSDRLYITDKYLSNGHWLVTREIAKSHVAPTALKPLLSCLNGGYFNGLKGGRDTEATPEMDHIVPKRDGYLPLSQDPARVKFRYNDEIESYVFTCGDFEIGINPKYVPLLRMGFGHAKDPKSPILVLADKSLNGDLMAVIMPMRLDV